MEVKNELKVLHLVSNNTGQEAYDEIYPLVKPFIDNNATLLVVEPSNEDDEFNVMVAYDFKDELLKAVEGKEEILSIDEYEFNPETGEVLSDRIEIFPSEDYDADDNEDDEGLVSDDDVLVEEQPTETVSITTHSHESNETADVASDENQYGLHDDNISGVDELMPTSEDIIKELNPAMMDLPMSTNPVAVLTSQQHVSQISTLYALLSPQLMSLDYNELENELENFKHAINPKMLPEVERYLKAKKLRQKLVDDAETTATNIKETYESNFKSWLDEQIEYLKEQYAIDHPDTTDEQISQLYAGLQPELVKSEQEIDRNRTYAEQAMLREFVRNNKNQALNTAMMFVMTKQNARDEIKKVYDAYNNSRVDMFDESSYNEPAYDEPVYDEPYTYEEPSGTGDDTWFGYTDDDLANMSNAELQALQEKYESGELEREYNERLAAEANNVEDEPVDDLTEEDVEDITFDDEGFDELPLVEDDDLEISFTSDEDSDIDMIPEESDIDFVDTTEDDELVFEPEDDLGQTGTLPVIDDEDFDFDAAAAAIADELDFENNQTSADESAIEDEDSSFDNELAEAEDKSDTSSAVSQQNIFEDDLIEEEDDFGFDEDLNEPDKPKKTKKGKEGKKNQKKQKNPGKKSWVSSKTGKAVMTVGAILALSGIGAGTYFALNSSDNQPEQTQNRSDAAKKFFNRAKKVGVDVDKSIQLTVTDNGKAVEEDVIIKSLNKDGSITVERDNGETLEVPYGAVLDYVKSQE